MIRSSRDPSSCLWASSDRVRPSKDGVLVMEVAFRQRQSFSTSKSPKDESGFCRLLAAWSRSLGGGAAEAELRFPFALDIIWWWWWWWGEWMKVKKVQGSKKSQGKQSKVEKAGKVRTAALKRAKLQTFRFLISFLLIRWQQQRKKIWFCTRKNEIDFWTTKNKKIWFVSLTLFLFLIWFNRFKNFLTLFFISRKALCREKDYQIYRFVLSSSRQTTKENPAI